MCGRTHVRNLICIFVNNNLSINVYITLLIMSRGLVYIHFMDFHGNNPLHNNDNLCEEVEISMIIIIALMLYIIIGTFIALLSRRYMIKGDPSDYFIARRSLGGFISAMTYAATTYSAFMMIGLVGLAYATGVGALGFELTYMVGTLFLLSLLAPRAWLLSRNKGFITSSSMLGVIYESKLLACITALIVLIALIPYSSIQLIGIAKLFEGLMGFRDAYLIGLVTACFLTITWSILGGLRGIAWTDAFQGIIMLFTSVFLLLWCIMWGFGDINNFINSSAHILTELNLGSIPNWYWNIKVFLAYTIPWIFFSVTNPQVVQRLYMPKNIHSLRKMIIYFAFFGLVYTAIVTLLGISIRVLAENGLIEMVNPYNKSLWNLVTPKFLNYVPTILAIFTIIGIMSAAISTIDSIILTLSSMIVKDVMLTIKKDFDKRHEVYIGQLLVIIFTVIAMLFAYLKPAFVVDLAVLSSTILLSFAPLTIGGFIIKRKPLVSLTILSALMGLLIVLINELLELIIDIDIASYIPLPIIILTLSSILYMLGFLIRKK